MIVDFHIHIGRMEDFHPWVLAYHKKMKSNFCRDYKVLSKPENFVEFLKKEGVDYGVVLAEKSPITTGIVTNEYVLEFCKNQKSLIPFASINPNLDPNPKKLLEDLYKMGIRGLKFYPSYHQHYPNEERMYPIYAKAQELNLPVMFHTGTSIFKGSRLKYADPIHLDDVAVDFPDLNILLVHSGRGFWHEKAFFLSKIHKNVYMEISGLPPKNLLKYFPDLEKNQDKVIFGSDWPGCPGIKKNIEEIKKLPISKKVKRKILGENASKILKL